MAAVKYLAASGIEILSLKTTMQVPKTPSQRQTLFIWPALQNKSAPDPGRIQNGILQPVLTWGPSCNPKLPSSSEYYSKWWIAGMYVNVSSAAAGPTGCAGGDYMLTDLGDLLEMDISVEGTKWTQTIVNARTMESVDFTIDLKGQVQNWATWAVEVPERRVRRARRGHHLHAIGLDVLGAGHDMPADSGRRPRLFLGAGALSRRLALLLRQDHPAQALTVTEA